LKNEAVGYAFCCACLVVVGLVGLSIANESECESALLCVLLVCSCFGGYFREGLCEREINNSTCLLRIVLCSRGFQYAVALVATSEKGYVSVKVTLTSPGGHSRDGIF
jgi:hypothetical protein